MSSRKRAQERDYNRRRHMVLDKGFHMVYHQKDTYFGNCLLTDNVKEKDKLEKEIKGIERRGQIDKRHKDQEISHFVIVRDQATREPTVILEREPDPDCYADYVDMNAPRYMRHLESRQSAPPPFPVICAYKAETKHKRNLWESDPNKTKVTTADGETPVNTEVRFRNCLSSPSPTLVAAEKQQLFSEWRSLKYVSQMGPPKSGPSTTETVVKSRRLPTPLRNAVSDVARRYCISASQSSSRAASSMNESVFITQMGSEMLDNINKQPSRPSTRSSASTITPMTPRRKVKREEARLNKAFAEIYHVMRQNTAQGALKPETMVSRPRKLIRPMSTPSCLPSDRGDAVTAGALDEVILVNTKCRTAESARILASVQKKNEKNVKSESESAFD